MTLKEVMKGEKLMKETEEWLEHLRKMGRKESTISTHRNNVSRCISELSVAGRHCGAAEVTKDDIMFLWFALKVKEEVKRSYLRSFSQMVCYQTGHDLLKNASILYNRETRQRTFIDDCMFSIAYRKADPMEKVILCLGAFMGLRRNEMVTIKDSDLKGGYLTVHGKGHGAEGLVARMPVPMPVMKAIDEYRKSSLKSGIRLDDSLLQSRDHSGRLHQVLPSRISELMHDLGIRCGFSLTTHSLRRYFATTLYYNTGVDLQTLKSMLRHADVSTTLKCYVQCSEVKNEEARRALTVYLEKVTAEGRS